MADPLVKDAQDALRTTMSSEVPLRGGKEKSHFVQRGFPPSKVVVRVRRNPIEPRSLCLQTDFRRGSSQSTLLTQLLTLKLLLMKPLRVQRESAKNR